MSNVLLDITTTAEEVIGLEAKIAAREEELKALTKKRDNLVMSVLPDLMFGAEITELKLTNGQKLTIKDDLRASIRTLATIQKIKDVSERQAALYKREKAIQWLKENGLDGLVKTDVEVHLGRGQEDLAKKAMDLLEDSGLEPVMAQEVHAGTLSAALRALAAAGQDIDHDLLNATLVRKAVI